MRRILPAVLLFASLAWAADFTGRWWGEAVLDGGSQPVYLTLIQEGATLRGSGGPTPSSQELLTNGKIEGKKLTFDIAPATRSPLHFELVDEGQWLKGTVKLMHNGQSATGQVSVRRRTS